jgi:hypothetical protein
MAGLTVGDVGNRAGIQDINISFVNGRDKTIPRFGKLLGEKLGLSLIKFAAQSIQSNLCSVNSAHPNMALYYRSDEAVKIKKVVWQLTRQKPECVITKSLSRRTKQSLNQTQIIGRDCFGALPLAMTGVMMLVNNFK